MSSIDRLQIWCFGVGFILAYLLFMPMLGSVFTWYNVIGVIMLYVCYRNIQQALTEIWEEKDRCN